MQKGMYREVYDELLKKDFEFTLNNIALLFPKMNSKELYLFIMYSISRKETVEKHIAICDTVMFMNPCISDSYNLVAWHLRKALEIKPKSVEVLQWICDSFIDHPESPFNGDELFEYKNLLQSLLKASD